MRLPRASGRAGLVGLCAFVLLDVALVVAALNSTRAEVPNGGARITAGPAGPVGTGAGAATAPGATDSAIRAARAGGALQAEPLTVGLVAVDADTAWRFAAGSCVRGGSTLDITDDGGRTWQPRAAPFDTTARLRVRPDLTAFVVGADKDTDCRPMIRQASGRADEWGPAAAVSDAWYRHPSDAAVVGTPLGKRVRPCGNAEVIDLAIRDDGADALCAGGEVMVSSNGSKWSRRATAQGALALAAAADGRSIVALAGAVGCTGLAVADATAPGDPLGCAETALGDVEAGTVTLSIAGENAWLGVGAEVFRSAGSLSTWRKG